MISEEELDRYRQEGIRIRVERDAVPENDIKGIVVAWDKDTVLVRKQNRKLLKLSRGYRYVPDSEERKNEV